VEQKYGTLELGREKYLLQKQENNLSSERNFFLSFWEWLIIHI
jgi:hypothetical protein